MFESLNNLAYAQFLGKSVLFFSAIVMLVFILITGITAWMYSKRIAAPANYKLHKWFGVITIIVGLFHALLGFAKYLM